MSRRKNHNTRNRRIEIASALIVGINDLRDASIEPEAVSGELLLGDHRPQLSFGLGATDAQYTEVKHESVSEEPATNSTHSEPTMNNETNEMPRELAEEYASWMVGTMEYVSKAAGAAWSFVVDSWQESLLFSALGGGALALYFVLAGVTAPILFILQAAFSTLEIFLYSNVLAYVTSFAWYLLPERVRNVVEFGATMVTAFVTTSIAAAIAAPILAYRWIKGKITSWFLPSDEAVDEKALNAKATLRAV